MAGWLFFFYSFMSFFCLKEKNDIKGKKKSGPPGPPPLFLSSFVPSFVGKKREEGVGAPRPIKEK